MGNQLNNLKKTYRYDEQSRSFHIDIRIDDYRDLYNEGDYAPVKRRDLDQGLLQFLNDCSEEVPLKYGFIINFYLPAKMKNSAREARSIEGLRNFFDYSIRRLGTDKRTMLKTSSFYGFSGALLLTAGFLVQNFFKAKSAFVLL